ncbi:hypothetical protein DBR06_SOUSAS31410006, partial [Sousa chinensis]
AAPVLTFDILVFLWGFSPIYVVYYVSKGHWGYSYGEIPDLML